MPPGRITIITRFLFSKDGHSMTMSPFFTTVVLYWTAQRMLWRFFYFSAAGHRVSPVVIFCQWPPHRWRFRAAAKWDRLLLLAFFVVCYFICHFITLSGIVKKIAVLVNWHQHINVLASAIATVLYCIVSYRWITEMFILGSSFRQKYECCVISFGSSSSQLK